MVMASALIAMAGERDIVGEGERVGGDSASVGEGETVGDSARVGEGETVGSEAAEDDDDIAAPSTDAAVQSEISTQLSLVVQHASMPSNISSHGAFSTMPPQSAVPFGEQSRTQDAPVPRSR